MISRESVWENIAGDLEYHPRRAVIYLSLGAISLGIWIFSPHEFTIVPLVFGLGSLTLLLKGVFLLRKSSEGIGLTEEELSALSHPSNRKALPSIASQSAQVVQDFGAGAFLLGLLLDVHKIVAPTWRTLPRYEAFLTGAILFATGWLIRFLTSSPDTAGLRLKDESF